MLKIRRKEAKSALDVLSAIRNYKKNSFLTEKIAYAQIKVKIKIIENDIFLNGKLLR